MQSKHMQPAPRDASFVQKSKLSFEFSIIRLSGCAAAVSWFIFTNFLSFDSNQDRKQVANIGALIVFLEFLQNHRKPSPLGRLVNIFKLGSYFWWLFVGASMFKKVWATINTDTDDREQSVFAVHALNFLILIKIWSQIEFLHQAFADVFSRFNLRAGTYISLALSAFGLYMSYSLAALFARANACDLQGAVLGRWFCHSSQPKSYILLLFSVALLTYQFFLQHNYKISGKGFLPKGALINPDPSILQPGDMVIPCSSRPLHAARHTAAGDRVRRTRQPCARSCGSRRACVERPCWQSHAFFVHHEGRREVRGHVAHGSSFCAQFSNFIQPFCLTTRAPCRLQDLKAHMHSIANPPPGKTPIYYVILRPKALLPKQIALMHSVALLMIEQNQMCESLDASHWLTSHPIKSRNHVAIRFKKRVPTTVAALPAIVQSFVKMVCKGGIDRKNPQAEGNLGYDSGYDWLGAHTLMHALLTLCFSFSSARSRCNSAHPSHVSAARHFSCAFGRC